MTHSIRHEAFADDIQLYEETAPDQIKNNNNKNKKTIDIMQNCITDVKLWVTHNKLQLNDGNTELLASEVTQIFN